jgi:alginate O-acetyltransferase complex protein AlgJ
MQRLYRMSRYLLPIAFFGYAPFANIAFWEEPGGKIAPFDMEALRGSVTHSFDTAYKTSMPHRAASVGLVGAARYVLLGEGRKGVLAGTDGWLFTAEEARPVPASLSQTADRISQVQAVLALSGTTLVVVPIPAKIDVQDSHLDAPELTAAIADLYTAFRDALEQKEIAAVDARTPLVTLAATQNAFFPTDTHWTSAGAKTVADAIAASGLIAMGDATIMTSDEPTKTLTGDLVSFVTSDTLAPQVGLAPETVTPYLSQVQADAAATDIFAADSVDIVLVGTSYSANPDWSFAEALKQSLRRDVLNMAAQGQGPVKPMVDYLASPEFRDTPPKVVIWEIPIRYLTDPALWADFDIGTELASAD